MEDGENVSVFSPTSLGMKIQTPSLYPASPHRNPEPEGECVIYWTQGLRGIAWAIAGKRHRSWFEPLILGKVRDTSLASTGWTFVSKNYIVRTAKLDRTYV